MEDKDGQQYHMLSETPINIDAPLTEEEFISLNGMVTFLLQRGTITMTEVLAVMKHKTEKEGFEYLKGLVDGKE